MTRKLSSGVVILTAAESDAVSKLWRNSMTQNEGKSSEPNTRPPTKSIQVDELLCDECNLLTRASIVGQGFTDYTCECCEMVISYHNTGTPKICKACAIERGECQRCTREITVVFF